MKLTFLVSKVFQKMETLPFTFKRYSALRASLYFLDEVSGLYYQRCLHVFLASSFGRHFEIMSIGKWGYLGQTRT